MNSKNIDAILETQTHLPQHIKDVFSKKYTELWQEVNNIMNRIKVTSKDIYTYEGRVYNSIVELKSEESSRIKHEVLNFVRKEVEKEATARRILGYSSSKLLNNTHVYDIILVERSDEILGILQGQVKKRTDLRNAIRLLEWELKGAELK